MDLYFCFYWLGFVMYGFILLIMTTVLFSKLDSFDIEEKGISGGKIRI